MIWAVTKGHTEITQALLDKSANTDIQNNDGNTALILAAAMGHTEITQALLDKSANTDIQNNDGNTALIRAAAMGHTEITQALLDKGANTDIQNNDGNTALNSAAFGDTRKLSLYSREPNCLDLSAPLKRSVQLVNSYTYQQWFQESSGWH